MYGLGFGVHIGAGFMQVQGFGVYVGIGVYLGLRS